MRISRKHIQALTDEKLVLLYQQSKDQQYIGELYTRYSPLVMGVCLKYLKNISDAQDLLMQIFEKLIKDLPRHEVRSFKPWLFQLSKNECLMLLRKNKKITHVPMENVTLKKEEDHNIEEHLQKEELLSKLEEFIPELKENQRICIELFFLHKKSYAQIAEETHLSLKEVKSNLQNGKRNLELKLNKSAS